MASDKPEDHVNSAVNSVVENFSKLPASQTGATTGPKTSGSRLFSKDRTVHQIMGGGKSADVLLWRNKPVSGGVLAVSTITWLLFEWSGYTLLSLLSNVLLFLIIILFLWSNAAALLNRSPPPLPELSLSEETVLNTATMVRGEVNKILFIAHYVALGNDFKLFLKVIAGLWIVSTIGAWFNFLTLLYIAIVLGHTLPFLYEKYEDEVDKYAKVAADHANVQYKKFDAQVLSKIPKASLHKEKKIA